VDFTLGTNVLSQVCLIGITKSRGHQATTYY